MRDTKRFEAITLDPEPKRVTVVLATDYDDVCKRWLHQIDCTDTLKGLIERLTAHRPACEQESGDPYCNCAAITAHHRNEPPS